MIRACVSAVTRAPLVAVAAFLLLGGAGVWALQSTPVDAFPDVSENQVIVFTDWPGRSPQDVEDQISYPLSTGLQGIAGVESVRGMSAFGFSQIYVVFRDGIDVYWARTRVLERLATLTGVLPAGVKPVLGPDATPLGQVFAYSLEGPGYDRGELRVLQDYVVRYALQAVEGVSEVASVGGFVPQYQVDVDPMKLKAYGVGIDDVIRAVRQGNLDVGARTLEQSDIELTLRGRGFIDSRADIEDLVVRESHGTPIFVRHVANVQLGPDFRRGALADHRGEQVGGVVTMRYGENPRAVIGAVREAITEIERSLPEGIEIRAFYDRSQLIDETLNTLSHALWLELFITLLVVLVFVMHARTSLLVAATLPLAVLLAFIGMRALDLGADMLSLAGIAIAIGSVVDMAIIVSESVFERVAVAGDDPESQRRAVIDGTSEVAPAIAAAVATTVLGFLPVFLLDGEAGKLFTPLAWTKSFAMVAALVITVALVPALCRLYMRDASRDAVGATQVVSVLAIALIGAGLGYTAASSVGSSAGGSSVNPVWAAVLGALALGALGLAGVRERLRPARQQPVGRAILRLYTPALRWVLGHRSAFALAPVALVVAGGLVAFGGKALTGPFHALAAATGGSIDDVRVVRALEETFVGLGTAFMPPLDEGSYLAMPSTLPQASFNESLNVMSRMNRAIASVPEVTQVMGKLGRAETALDPAPGTMIETVVNLLPKRQWREGLTEAELLSELAAVSAVPGTTPSWLQPIETRIVMLQSGLRATMALQIQGSPLGEDGRPLRGLEAHRAIEEAALAMEGVVQAVPGTRDVAVLRQGGKPYLEYELDRRALARYGLSVEAVQQVIATAIGGETLEVAVEGRERTPIRVAYERDDRDSLEALERVLVPTPAGAHIPIGSVAHIESVIGPAAIRTEDSQLVGYVMFNAADVDAGGLMGEVLAAVEQWRSGLRSQGRGDPIPSGLSVQAAGRYESQARAESRLMLIIPLVLLLAFGLLALTLGSLRLTAAVFFAVPVAFGGGALFVWAWPHLLDLAFALGLREAPAAGPVELTTAVWVGFIALFGLAVDDGVVIATYLRRSFAAAPPQDVHDVRERVLEAGQRRIRALVMTTATTVLALLPILVSTGRGADLMQPMVLPLFGGMLASSISVFVVPALYAHWAERALHRSPAAPAPGCTTSA